jgi:hypothetical protein
MEEVEAKMETWNTEGLPQDVQLKWVIIKIHKVKLLTILLGMRKSFPPKSKKKLKSGSIPVALLFCAWWLIQTEKTLKVFSEFSTRSNIAAFV